jgi:hypothetical protein
MDLIKAFRTAGEVRDEEKLNEQSRNQGRHRQRFPQVELKWRLRRARSGHRWHRAGRR